MFFYHSMLSLAVPRWSLFILNQGFIRLLWVNRVETITKQAVLEKPNE